MSDDADAASPADRLARAADESGRTIAVAESLTGGSLSARLAALPGAGEWYRGGVVAYAPDVKHDVLGVPSVPVVSQTAAAALAEGVAELLGADVAVAVTGVGGPGPQDGVPPGTVWMGFHDGTGTATRLFEFDGEPGDVVRQTCDAALEWLTESYTRDGAR
jgi:nicotinamide-nucleotide amidase